MAIRCYGCMKLTESIPVCEHCGYDARSENGNHQLPAGTIVGNQYILGKVLGQGGFGITYMGYDRIMQQPVAVKEYFPSGYAGRDTRNPTYVTSYDNADSHAFESNKQRFLREAESLAKLWSIPQVVRVLRHFEENGTAYIVMEYAEGMDLRAYLKKLDEIHGLLSIDAFDNEDDNGTDYIQIQTDDVAETVAHALLIEKLRSVIYMLTEEEKELISLHFYLSVPQTEIAKHMGMSQQAVSKRIRKICAKLKKMLDP